MMVINNYQPHILLDTLKIERENLITQNVSIEELSKHNTIDNRVWVSVNQKVYDLTDFLHQHPGGAKIIMKYGGKDATKIFNSLHPVHVLDLLDPEQCIGEMSEPFPDSSGAEEPTEQELARLNYLQKMPKISKIFNLNEFEYVAKKILTPEAWAYYSGGSDNEITLRENHYAFQKYFFNPRVLVDVRQVDISTTMLGVETAAPFYCSAAALAKLGHPDGELSISKGCGKENVIQMISSTASYGFDEILDVALPHQPHWFQLYVKPDRAHSFEMIKKCEARGVKAIFVTVDTPLLGRREKDFKFRYDDDVEDVEADFEEDPLKSFQDPGLTWKDIDEFKKVTSIPIVVKGVQTPEDVLLAIDHKVDAVVLSNHGGRQLDFSRAPVDVLEETMALLKQKNLQDSIEIYIDGGVKRGTDVVKALCLGAKGVGLGRPFLYANSCYGEPGVKKAIQLLKNEIILSMKLMGVTKIEDLNSDLLDLRGVDRKGHGDMFYDSLYEPLSPPEFGSAPAEPVH